MSDSKILLFAAIAVAGLVYCLWKTQSDWQRNGFGFAVAWGIAASLSAFFFVAFLFASSVLNQL